MSDPVTSTAVLPAAEEIVHVVSGLLAAAGLRGAPPAPRRARRLASRDGFKVLRRVSLCRGRIGAITAAALVLLHHAHGRTT